MRYGDMDRQFSSPRLVCTVCGFEAKGDWGSLRTGWRKCCGYTMRLITGNEVSEAEVGRSE